MMFGLGRFSVLVLIWPNLIPEICGQVLMTIIGNKCITNTSSAMAPIYSLSDSAWDKSKNIDPEGTSNYQDNWVQSNNYWKKKNSLQLSPLDPLIVDQQWEDFPFYLTRANKMTPQSDYKMVAAMNDSDIVVPFSLQIDQNAFVSLCGGTAHVTCYQFILQGWGGKKSEFRICNDKTCNNPYESKPHSHNVKFPKFLSADKWNHLKIVKKGANLQLVTRHGMVLMDHTDVENTIINNVFFHSRNVNGLWKLHNYDYLFTEAKAESILKLKVPSSGAQCVSMFVTMCRNNCYMNVIISTDYNSDKWVNLQKLFNKDIGWNEVTTCADVATEYLYLKITTICETWCKPFWALRNIRISQENELRILTVNPSLPWTGNCQFLESGLLLKKNEKITSLSNWGRCKENEFGEDCMSCQDNICLGEKKYCQMIYYEGMSYNHCYCSIGYKGPSCREKCSYGSYGHSCKRRCANCQDGCDKDTISGKCDTKYCTDNYEGEKCDQPPGLFLFDDPPTVKVGYNSFKLILDSFKGIGNARNMKRYRFEYRKKGHREWENSIKSGEDLKFNQPQWVTIDDLELYSTYEIRVFGYESEKDLYQLEHVEPNIFEFTTSCDELNSSHIKITPNTTWAIVVIVLQGATPICKLSDYQLMVNDSTLRKGKTGNNEYIANKLKPFTLYNLEIKKNNDRKFFVPFKTMESTPGDVENFDIVKVPNQPSAVTLKWTNPLSPNGNLLYYTLYITLISLFACNNPVNRTSSELYIEPNIETWDLAQLKPFAHYYIGIVANTSAGFGNITWISLETNSIDQIQDEEIPPLTSVITSNNLAIYAFECFTCERLMGPLKINIMTKGTDPWCSKNTITTEQKMSNNITVTGLLPFCNYTGTLQYIRNEISQRQTNTSFQTKEAAPNLITDLLVTSKGPDHISLRWQPPYPPTGNLDEYQIYITYNSRGYWHGEYTFLRHDIITPTPCKLWPELHCATIRNITKDFIYWLYIRSKNKGYNGYSHNEGVQAKAVETTPEPPYGLEASWTNENHLVVQWFHPNQTGGTLLSFKILINDDPYQMKIYSENDYRLVYQKTVTTNLKFPSSYNISVTAKNSAKDSNAEVLYNVKSPPPIPDYSVENIAKKGSGIKVWFKQLESSFKRFLYVLISECGTCENTLIEFRDKLMTHHNISDKAETATAIRQWARHPNPNGQEYLQEITIKDLHDYHIDENDTYYLGFIWIHKYHGYVRSNYSIQRILAESRKRSGNSSYIIAGVVVPLIIIMALCFLYLRYRARIIIVGRKTKAISNKASKTSTSSKTATEPIYVNQDDLPLIQAKQKRTRYRNSIRPLSILVTEEICPGTPMFRTQNSKRVKLNHFLQYVRDAIESGELERQHAGLPEGQTQEWTHGVRPENKSKNRYQNMIAYDHSRVVLDRLEDDEYSDYINANFIDGYRHPRAYIATQGPKKNTVTDFWRMIWQERVTHIIVMANVIEGGKKKIEQYWPNANEEESFGDFRVSFLTSEMYANYEYRKFEVQYRYLKPRQVCQLHFKVWPDHGIPLYAQSLVPVLERMLKMRSTDFPLVVHCSAGVGRTGTVILSDICLRMAAAEGYVDAFSMLEHIRSQRPNMVDNTEQYKLVHLVILNCLMGLKTGVPLNEDFERTVTKNQDLDLQLEYIRSCEWQDDAMKTVGYMAEAPPPIVAAKNRFPDILPDRTARVLLHPYPATNPSASSTYINAVRVDGFCHPGRFVVTHFPLPDFIGDFWRLVAEQDTSVIVCLNDIPTGDPVSAFRPFWPLRNGELRPVDVVCVKHIKTISLQVYSIISFELTSFYEYQGTQSRPVDIVHFHGWKYPTKVPDYSDFIAFVEDATAICRRSPRVLVTCYDGATASGLFIALTFLMEKIKLERECDVCQAVRSIRTSRKEFTNCREQLEFLYKASILYVQDKFLQYSNSTLS